MTAELSWGASRGAQMPEANDDAIRRICSMYLEMRQRDHN